MYVAHFYSSFFFIFLKPLLKQHQEWESMCERDHARLSSVWQNKREVKLYFIIISEQQKSRRSQLLVRSWSTEPEAFERLLCLVTSESTSSVRKHQLNILCCLSAVGQKLMMVFSIVSSRSGVVSSLWRNCSSVNLQKNDQPESNLNPVSDPASLF